MGPIQKFSLTYDPSEDRIAWDGEDADGAATRVWLTQRFCRELVAAMIARLPKPPGDAAPEAVAQGWAQAAAMSRSGRLPAVRLTDSASVGLVREVRMARSPKGIGLDFDIGADRAAHVDFSPAAARQMLGMLHDLHLAAGWPTGFWPAWITASVELEGASVMN